MRSLKSVGLALSLLLIGLGSSLPSLGGAATAQTVQAPTSPRKAEADRLFEQGTRQLNQQQPQAALATFQQALAIYRELKDRQQEAQTLRSIGNAHLSLKNYDSAIAFQQQALAIAQAIQDRDLEARALNNIGVAYKQQKQLDQAIAFYIKSLTVSRQAQNYKLIAMTANNLASLYGERKEYESAIAAQQDVLSSARQLNDAELEIKTLVALGALYQETKNPVKAIELFQQALGLAQQRRNQALEVSALAYLTQIYSTLGQSARVIEYGEPVLKMAQSLKLPALQAEVAPILGAAYVGVNQPQAAIAVSQQVFTLGEAAAPQTRSKALLIIALAYLQANQDKAAVTALQSLLESAAVDGRKLTRADARKQAEAIVNSLRQAMNRQQAGNAANPAVLPAAMPSSKPLTATEQTLQTAQNYQKAGENRQAIAALLPLLKTDRLSPELAARSYNLLARAYVELGEDAEAIAAAQRAIALAQKLKNSELEGFGFVWQAIALGQFDPQRANQAAQQAIVLSRTINQREIEAWATFALANTANNQQQVDLAQKALAIAREINNREIEAWANFALASGYVQIDNYQKAAEADQAALTIAQALKNRTLEGYAQALSTIVAAVGGKAETVQSAFPKATVLASELKNDRINAYALIGLAAHYTKTEEYQKVIQPAQQALAIAQKQQFLELNSTASNLLANSYIELKNYQEVAKIAQQLITVSQQRKDAASQAGGLKLLALAYAEMGQTQLANQTLQAGESIAQQIPAIAVKVNALSQIRYGYELIGNWQKNEQISQQLLTLVRRERDPNLMWQVIDVIAGSQIRKSGNFKELSGLFDEYLTLVAQTRKYDADKLVKLMLLNFLYLQDYQKAEKIGKEYLTYAREQKNRNQELGALFSLAITYWQTGDRAKSEQLLNDLAKFRQSQNASEQAFGLFVEFCIFYTTEKYAKAVDAAEAFIRLIPRFSDKNTTPFAQALVTDVFKLLSAPAYAKANRSQEAIAILQEGMTKLDKFSPLLTAFTKDQTNPLNPLKSMLLTYIAEIYRQSGQPIPAIAAYQQALALSKSASENQAAKNPAPLQTLNYAGIAQAYQQRNQPITAITYYKQAVNQLEYQRRNNVSTFLKSFSGKLSDLAAANLTTLSQNLFLKGFLGDLEGRKNSDVYRQLADLLISQGRLGEAQQVLELLKTQELNEFSGETRSTTPVSKVGFNQVEKQLLSEYGTLIAFGNQLEDCKAKQCSQLDRLSAKYDVLFNSFAQLTQDIEKQAKTAQIQDISNRTEDFNQSAGKIANQPNTVLIYPLVLPDKVHLLWMARGKVRGRQVCPIGQTKLWQTVKEFRELLRTPRSDIAQIKSTGKVLYDCLVKPLEAELTKNNIQNLVFVPDRAINYIPIGALFDGQKYLVERYTISTVLNAALTDMSSRLPDNSQSTSVLALGVSEGKAGFAPLPNVPAELDAIVRQKPTDTKGIYPGLELINQTFTRAALQTNLSDRKILHIATHGAFLPEDPKASFLLLGTGEKYPIYQVQDLDELRNVHLVVLSACETALGGPDANGIEIAGISSYFLKDRAKAVVASLWAVNDASTSFLMQQFYKNLAVGKMTKAAALRQAQRSLLDRDSTAADRQRQAIEEAQINPQADPKGQARQPVATFAHPYYWAPFILIGNSL